MLALAVFTHPAYGSNSYLLWDRARRKALIVDPGNPDVSAVRTLLDRESLRLDSILLTHEHYDHIAGVNSLRELYGCRLVCSRECGEAILDPARNFSRYLAGTDYRCAAPEQTCGDLGGQLDFDGVKLFLAPTPGHSPGSICIAVEELLFTGDTLIRDTRTVTKLPGGNKRALGQSLDSIRRRFSPDFMVRPGHGALFRLSEWSAA